MPRKRRLVTSELCFGTEKAGLLDFSYNKCALPLLKKMFVHVPIKEIDETKLFPFLLRSGHSSKCCYCLSFM